MWTFCIDCFKSKLYWREQNANSTDDKIVKKIGLDVGINSTYAEVGILANDGRHLAS